MAEELKKSLGFFGVSALILTSMIGTSLFFGIAAGARLAGPASLIAWALMGVITIYVAACFGELISMFPSSGGVYEFTKQAFGRFPSFLIGWITWIVANIGSAVLVVAALDFLLPGAGTINVGGYLISRSLIRLVFAVAIIFLFNYITFRGIEASGTLLLAFALIMISLLVLTIVPGFMFFDGGHFAGMTAVMPVALLLTMFFLVESFFGWEAASFLAEETVEPQRTIPRALLFASSIVVLLGLLLAVMVFGALPAGAVGLSENPLVSVAEMIFPYAVPAIIIGVFLTFLGGVISNTVSSPRLLFALSRDRLFVEQAQHLHPKYKTPANAIIFQTLITVFVVIIAFGQYDALLSMLVPLALFMYGIVLLTIPVLRRKKPHHSRPFKVWFGNTGPYVIALFYFAIVAAWFIRTPGSLSTLLLIAGFIALALPIYFFLTMVYNPDAIISISNSAARINYLLEDFLFPREVREEILALFKGNLRGKEIVEFGSGVGTFTMHLAEEVGPQGKVVAVDFSRNNIDILTSRLEKHGHRHVRLIHDEHQVNRLHPDVKRADAIYSVGFLGYVQDLQKVLREMNMVLVPSGRICFVEYTNFFKVLPDPAIVSDIERLERHFRDAGFAVSVHKRSGLLWNYLIISGIKTDKKVPYI